MNFLALDFETANARRDSICEVGLAVVAGGRVVDVQSWRVRPEPNTFDWRHTRIHGIDARAVAAAPTFAEWWAGAGGQFEGANLVAHNASFDLSVLRHGLKQGQLSLPRLRYVCSVQVARRAWPGRASYSLGKLAPWLGIALQHHAAGSDAAAPAHLILRAAQAHHVADFDALATAFSVRLGQMRPDPPAFAGPAATTDGPPLFAGQTVVFTGYLRALGRAEARRRVVQAGGRCEEWVTAQTHLLVVGARASLSSDTKVAQAHRLRAAGADVQLLTEPEFLALLS